MNKKKLYEQIIFSIAKQVKMALNEGELNEWKEDMGTQIIIIMGTPGCGKTYWMQHTAYNFFRKVEGITLSARELDVDHTLKKYQLAVFPIFCNRVLNFKSMVVIDGKTGKNIHNNALAWQTFMKNEQQRFEVLNREFGGNENNIPDLSQIDYNFCAPYISRYYNAKDEFQPTIEKEFVKAMEKKYFKTVFASDFSVRGEAKAEYDDSLVQKVITENNDVIIAISGAKMKHIDTICQSALNKDKETDKTVRIVFLNGSVDKAVYQDAKRERSGGEQFVREYAKKIDAVWNSLIDPNSKDYYKNKNIYKIYELIDAKANDELSYPVWKLKKVYENNKNK